MVRSDTIAAATTWVEQLGFELLVHADESVAPVLLRVPVQYDGRGISSEWHVDIQSPGTGIQPISDRCEGGFDRIQMSKPDLRRRRKADARPTRSTLVWTLPI
jgi:hypothetical protein